MSTPLYTVCETSGKNSLESKLHKKVNYKREALEVIKMHINKIFWQRQLGPLAYLGLLPSIGIFPFAFNGHGFRPWRNCS